MTSALDGIKVVDLTIARAGPTAVRQLADWGASVVRVEPPGGRGGFVGDHGSSDYLNLHRNKRLINLNLKSDAGREILYRLVDDADVLVENYRPPVKHRLGFDYETLAARNPRLVYGSVSGFGQDGPYADKGAVDQIIQGMGGLMSITGLPGQGPVRAGVAITDLAAAHQLALGIMVALFERQTSGRGQWVQVSLLEAMIAFLDFQGSKWTVDGEVAGQAGNDHPDNTPMGTFQAADGYLNLAASSQNLWEAFCAAVDEPTLLGDPDYQTFALRRQHKERVNDAVQQVIAKRTLAEWVELLDAAGVPCGPVLAIDEVFADPQVRHLGVTVDVDHPVRGPVSVLRHPVRMSRTPHADPTPSPTNGQHVDEVLTELGYDAEAIAELRAAGAV